jgi:hypothetical protein
MTITEQFPIRNRWTNAVQFNTEITCARGATIGLKVGLAVRWANLSRADLSGADLRRAYLLGADLRDANLGDADLSGANLSWADLSGADLRGANLSRADLSGADLRGANLNWANLSGANLSRANLRGANLSNANLRGANLSGANLSDADLSGADLSGADLRGANLRFFKADMWMTLTQARGEVPALVSALREGRVDGSQYEGECACLVGTLSNARAEQYRTAFPDATRAHPAEQWFLMIRKGDKPSDKTGGGFAAAKALEWALEYCELTGIALPEPVQP